MELVYLQLPLVFFTAAAPMASGAFIGLAIAFLTTRFTDGELKRIDRWTALPLAILAVGVVAAAVFFNTPQSALLVLQGIDPGALTFAIVMAVVFALVAVVYWIVALTGRLSYGARKAFATVVGVLAVVYAAAIGIAYMMSAVPLWATVFVPVEFIGFSLAGGVPLGVLVLGAAGALPQARATRFASASMIASLIGVLVAIFAVTAQLLNAQATAAAFFPGDDLLAGSWVYLLVSIVGFVITLACLRGALAGLRTSAPLGRTAGASVAMPMGSTGVADQEEADVRPAIPLLVVGNVIVLAAIIAARVLFYAMQF